MSGKPPGRQDRLRSLPSLDVLLRRPGVEALEAEHGREVVRGCLRDLLDSVRREILDGGDPDASPEALEEGLRREAGRVMAPGLRRVINATGIVIHTNMGRAPLPAAAREAVARTAGGYLNLELELETGERGRRGARLEEHVRAVTGAEAALVVNNNAGAVLLMLSALAEGREVVVSRGELVEIGGSFRLPDIMARSGARMREVGTTNRTRLADYEAAVGPETGLLLKVHPSNFWIQGFTEEVPLPQLIELGRERGIAVAMDLGSGIVVDPGLYGLGDEPRVQDVLAQGCELVTFSGDKALGGPQGGYLVGTRKLVERCRKNALHRALRPGRLAMAAAEATWVEYRRGREGEIPVLRMLALTPEELRARAEGFAARLGEEAPGLRVEIAEGAGRAGGGTAPEEALPAVLLSLELPGTESGELAGRLRHGSPAVMGRVREGRLLLDLRTVFPEEEDALLAALSAASGPA
jgi:L-seryl-tRNA(Ser) seleniumtransferase